MKTICQISSNLSDEYCSNLQTGKFVHTDKQISERKISKDICLKYVIGVFNKKYKVNNEYVVYSTIIIPYLIDEKGDILEYKTIPYDNNGIKQSNLIRAKGSCQIFPRENLKNKNIILCEGELDALSLISNGFNSISFTNGAGSIPKPEILDLLRGKSITILYDNDESGRNGSLKVAKALEEIAESIKIAKWQSDVDKYDVGDFFKENRPLIELTNIINSAEVYKTNDNPRSEVEVEREIIKEESEDYNYYSNDGKAKLIPSELAKYLANHAKIHIKSVQPDASNSRRIFYTLNDGFWKKVKPDYIRNIIINHLSFGFTENQINQVYNILGTLVAFDEENFNADPDLINLSNCAYNLKTFESLEHSQNLFFTYKNGYNFDPEAKCPIFDKALVDYSKDKFGKVDNDWIAGFWEVAGYCLTGDYEIHKMFWLYGSKGGEVKSTITDILSYLVGEALTKPNLDPSQLNGQFYKGTLIGKRLATTGELPPFIDNIETIKQLTGEDVQSTDVKFGEYKNFKNHAKLVFAMNRLPSFKSSEPIEPILRRIYLLPFDNPIPKNKFDSTLKAKFISELSGIFNRAIEGLRRLRKNGNNFTVCRRTEKLIENFGKEINMVAGFADENLIEDPKAEIWCTDLWNSYCEFMDKNTINKSWTFDKTNPKDRTKLVKDLSSLFRFSSVKKYNPDRGGSHTAYIGIRLMSDNEKIQKFNQNDDS